MQIPNSFHDLLILLRSTQSASQQLTSILKFYMGEGAIITDPKVQEVISYYEEVSSKQKETGKAVGRNNKEIAVAGSVESQKIAPKKRQRAFKQPMFVQDYKTGNECQVCHTVITPGVAFRWRQTSGEYYDYHATCIPEEHKELFLTDKKYLVWSRPLSSSAHNDNDEQDDQ